MNQIALLGGKNEPSMTSQEMADLTEKRHDSVKRTIDFLAKKGLIDVPHRVEYLDSLSRKATEYRIGKRDSYVVVARLSPEFTARVVDRWQQLEQAQPVALDLNDPQALRTLLLGYSERVLELNAKISADAPKVAFAEAIRAVDGVCSIEKIAKTIGIGRNKLFRRMRDDGVLMANNLPYQKYIDREYFTVIEQEPYTDSKGVQHPTFTTRVTGAGQVFLAKKYANIMGDA
jgi:phage antirepressor YoqD-like protein